VYNIVKKCFIKTLNAAKFLLWRVSAEAGMFIKAPNNNKCDVRTTLNKQQVKTQTDDPLSNLTVTDGLQHRRKLSVLS